LNEKQKKREERGGEKEKKREKGNVLLQTLNSPLLIGKEKGKKIGKKKKKMSMNIPPFFLSYRRKMKRCAGRKKKKKGPAYPFLANKSNSCKDCGVGRGEGVRKQNKLTVHFHRFSDEHEKGDHH